MNIFYFLVILFICFQNIKALSCSDVDVNGNLNVANTVTSITNGNFNGCSISTITIPASVSSIASNAFQNVSTITMYVESGNTMNIGTVCSSGSCYGATSGVVVKTCTTTPTCTEVDSSGYIYICKSVTSIDSNAFNGCISLTSVSFESGSQLTSIGWNAFHSTDLTTITIPASVTSIGGACLLYTSPSPRD